ncbi:unnamed protein product [Protopolystoma xenopodis]|uniref:Uncharacterized protein n=1 Tax=Protopolystoma xenopodis TaxID=117903 RepID=A0A3S5C8Z3_9PLAT|nr:unnamed protein product [Protopolystoma xenopodis]
MQYVAVGSISLGLTNSFFAFSSNGCSKQIHKPATSGGTGGGLVMWRDRHADEQRLGLRCLCLHAMSIVYARCFSEISSVSDIPLLVHLLDRTQSAAERDSLLLLLDRLMMDRVSSLRYLSQFASFF